MSDPTHSIDDRGNSGGDPVSCGDLGDLSCRDGVSHDADNTGSNRQAYLAAQSFLYDRLNYERLASGTARYPFRLQRTAELLDRLGLSKYVHCSDEVHSDIARPAVPLIHIAGTKGKGSTAAMVSSILTASGLKTGLYTSPHLNRIEERFRVNGAPFTPDEFVDLVHAIQPVVDELSRQEDHPSSFFEITTAMALMHFDRQGCDAIVLETGLGGRLDSTNVCASTVTAITTIGLDHQHVLGNTLGEIAREKAGIAKSEIPMICGVQEDEPRKVIETHATSVGAPIHQLGVDFDFNVQPADDWGSVLEYQGFAPPFFSLVKAQFPLEGNHQGHNAAMAISIAGLVAQSCSNTHQVTPASVANGLSKTESEARVERFRLPSGIEIIIDSAHNVDSIEALCQSVRFRAGSRPVTIVFGTSRDKDARAMIRRLVEVGDRVICTRFVGNPRFTSPSDLQKLIPAELEGKGIVEECPENALRIATNHRGFEPPLVVVCGSFFLAGEARQWVLDQISSLAENEATS